MYLGGIFNWPSVGCKIKILPRTLHSERCEGPHEMSPFPGGGHPAPMESFPYMVVVGCLSHRLGFFARVLGFRVALTLRK